MLYFMQFLIIILFLAPVAVAAKRYKDGKKSKVLGIFLLLIGALWLIAQFAAIYRNGGFSFHPAYLIGQYLPGILYVFSGWKLISGKRVSM